MASDIKVEMSEEFAIKIIDCYKYLQNRCNESIISKQILRSGTSIGANIAESIFAESNEDFVHKLRIALKEASETKYWLKLLYRTNFLDEKQFNNLNGDCLSLIKILTRIINSTGEKVFN